MCQNRFEKSLYICVFKEHAYVLYTSAAIYSSCRNSENDTSEQHLLWHSASHCSRVGKPNSNSKIWNGEAQLIFPLASRTEDDAPRKFKNIFKNSRFRTNCMFKSITPYLTHKIEFKIGCYL